MAHSMLLRSFILHRSTVLLPTVARLRCPQALHSSARLAQEANNDSRGNVGGLQSSSGNSNVSTDVRPIGEKIKENTKTASYTAIILAGLGVTGIMFYAIFRELFSKESSCNIYADALKRVVDDPRVQDAIGAPIAGETSRRGRRQRVAHTNFERNGVPHMRIQFYVQGLRNRATVQLESRKGPTGKLEYRYLFVQLDHYPRSTIVLEDNRATDPTIERTAPAFGNLALMSNNRDK